MVVVSAVASTRSGSVTVRADEHGRPVFVVVDEREVRFGGSALAATIMEQCRRATAAAQAERRALLAEDGVPAETLDLLGLPTRAVVAEQSNDSLAAEPRPTSWLRSV